EALDHQLFIAALGTIYLFRDWKRVVILVTAFTIGHSLTLLLSVLDLFRLPEKWVEFGIPLTILITAFRNLFQTEFEGPTLRINYFLALFFGLIHGLGFANTLRVLLAKDQNLVTGLLGFNIGLEAGQILMIFLVLLLSAFAVSTLKLKRREWVIGLSSGVLALALNMSLERIPF
ncbi:MAG: HupE/UreJ family protein, partial [Chitinophagaceae bacterium]